MSLKKFFSVVKAKLGDDKKAPVKTINREAKIRVSRLSYNTSIMYVDENGEAIDAPEPKPSVEELTVREGDKIGGFDVLSLTRNFVELESYMEYMEGNDPSPKTHFVVERGTCIDLTLYGLCDAVKKVSIECLEIAELGD